MEHLNNSPQAGEVILGVDTHLDVPVGVVIDGVGRLQGTLAIATNPGGYEQLLRWAQGFGALHRAGVEGAGSYGAGLTHFLEESGIQVVKANRPDRARRRSRGKSDPTDAESAARAVLAGDAKGRPTTHNGLAEALRIVSVARRSAVKARTQAINQLRALLVSAPSSIRDVALKVKPEQCVAACAALPTCDANPAMASLGTTLRLLARRWTALCQEGRELDTHLARWRNRRPQGFWPGSGWGLKRRRPCWPLQETIRRDCATKQPWRHCVVSVL